MEKKMTRRKFMGIGAAATASMACPEVLDACGSEEKSKGKTVRIGIVGLGGRGSSLLKTLLSIDGVKIPAVCDIVFEKAKKASDSVKEARCGDPEIYAKGSQDYERLMARDDLDAVIIATPWDLHASMAVCSMKAGKYAGVEVPAAITFDECWDLVNTSEKTGIPCMMLENWSFRRDNLAILNMIRQGLFGEIVHCHCAHSHDCIDHWFFDSKGNRRWPAEFLVKRNADQYPTHSVGPVLSWMDINCGDAFATLTSTASRSTGINRYFERKFGADHRNAKQKYAQGDIVTSVIKTHKGSTIVINYDMQLPRPYDNRWMIQGTLGLYDESKESVYIEGKSPEYHSWEPFGPYQNKYDHSLWKNLKEEVTKMGHGGTDYIELAAFVKAVRQKTQTPIDVYDSVTMSVIIPLSEKSIADDSASIQCPYFTRGKWKTTAPKFAVDA